MATAATTITRALRKLKVLGEGQTPSSVRQERALEELNGLIRHWVGYGASLPFRDVYVSSAYEICPDYPAQRLLCRHASALTITLPEGLTTRPIADGMRVLIVDAANVAATYNITLARNGWKIAGAQSNATINTNSASKLYMFRAELGDWKPASDLAAGDELPFPDDFDLDIALLLAMRLTEYGQRLGEDDRNAAIGAKARLRAKYVKPPFIAPENAAGNIGGATQTLAWPSDYTSIS